MRGYCGVDFHARQQTVCWSDPAKDEIKTRGLHHHRDDVRGFYAQLTSEVIMGLEASGVAITVGLPLRKRLLTKAGQQKLQALPMSPMMSQQREQPLSLLQELGRRIAPIKQWSAEQADWAAGLCSLSRVRIEPHGLRVMICMTTPEEMIDRMIRRGPAQQEPRRFHACHQVERGLPISDGRSPRSNLTLFSSGTTCSTEAHPSPVAPP